MKIYWKDIESKKIKEQEPRIEKTPEENPLFELFKSNTIDLPASRRDFLKLCGFGLAATALSSCQSKISKAVPYVIAPPEATPGEAVFYASSFISGNDYCSIIVKTRDGRPIKIEGNPDSGITMGGTSARVQASVLDLYDSGRFHGPVKEGISSDWDSIDAEIISKLEKIVEEKGNIVLLTPTIFSPSTEAVISGFLQKFKGSEWVQYDAISYLAMLEANKISFGKQVIPDFRFDNADLILSFGADFLGTWLSPVEYTKQFSSGRNPEGEMKKLIQLESNLSITGSNADKRIQIKPSHEPLILLNIYKEIVRVLENRNINAPASPVDVGEISNNLISFKGKSLVISGSNLKETQLLVNEINSLLGNIGHTVLFDSYLRTHPALDSNMEKIIGKMQKGMVNALLAWNVNPVYTWYNRNALMDGLKKVGLTISLTGAPDETNSLFQFICPDNHYLESWNDAEAKKEYFSLMQPTINHIFDTRQMTDSLLKWSGSTVSYYDFIKTYWVNNLMKRQKEFTDPVMFFDRKVQKGIFELASHKGSSVEKSLKSKSFAFNPAS